MKKSFVVRMSADLKKALELAKWEMKLSQNEVIIKALTEFLIKKSA